MKSSLIAASLLATLTLAKPLEKKWLVYTTEVETVTATVTGSWSWGAGWKHGSDWAAATSAPAPTTTSTSEVAPEATTPAWSQAPAPPAAAPEGPPPAAASPSTASTAPDDGYAQPILDQHNLHRANSSAPALSWSSEMASIAAQIAASCVYAHNTDVGGGGYGQNIGAGAEPSAVPAMITNEMYNDEIGWYPTPYGNSNPDMSNFEHWGHYSQIVWASTTAVGCATQYCPGGLANTGGDVSPYFTVCNYSPPGNFGGEYQNVGAPGGAATVSL